DDSRIDLGDIQARLSWLDPGSSGDDDDVGVPGIGIIAGVEIHRLPDRRGVRQVEHLSFRANRLDVDQDDLDAGNAVSAEQRGRASDQPGADNDNLALLDHPTRSPIGLPLDTIGAARRWRSPMPRMRKLTT